MNHTHTYFQKRVFYFIFSLELCLILIFIILKNIYIHFLADVTYSDPMRPRFAVWGINCFSSPASLITSISYTEQFPLIQKPNSWTYNFGEFSWYKLESYQIWGFRIQCLHYKPVSNHFCSMGGGVSRVELTLNSKEENFLRLWSNYVKEFGLRLGTRPLYFSFPSHPYTKHGSSVDDL